MQTIISILIAAVAVLFAGGSFYVASKERKERKERDDLRGAWSNDKRGGRGAKIDSRAERSPKKKSSKPKDVRMDGSRK